MSSAPSASQFRDGVEPLGFASQASPLQEFSVNLLEASNVAQAAVLRAAAQAPSRTTFHPDPLRLRGAVSDVLGCLLTRPTALMELQLGWLARSAEIVTKAIDSLVSPPTEPRSFDRRFSDPSWDGAGWSVLRNAYTLTSEWLRGSVADLPTTNAHSKRALMFFTEQMIDAAAPTNLLHLNPAALNEAVRTKGESLRRGAENFAADVKTSGGAFVVRQTDPTGFEVGKTLASTPGQVVYENELFQLLQFSPQTEQVHRRPLLFITPWINKYYILDLQPHNSMIRWLVGQGFTVFATSWVNPDARHAGKSFEDYLLSGVLTAIDKARVQSGSDRINAVGYCIGGTALACAMGLLAGRGVRSPLSSATLFTAQTDFSEAGDLLVFTSDEWLSEVESQVAEAGGVLPAGAMGGAFNALRSNDLIWSFHVNNYLLGKPPKPFDLLYWNSDQTRMPGAMHLWYLRELYQANKLSRGELQLGDVRIDLGKIETPMFIQAAREDHIAPAGSVYKGARLFGGPVTFMLAGSGHIAGVINPAGSGKYQHWVRDDLPETLDAWLDGAEEHPGSWWETWAAWLRTHSGEMTPARDPALGPLPPIEPAPGRYVKARA